MFCFRLEAYVKNANFGRKDDQQEKAFSLDVPEPSTYRDINLDTPLPAVTRKLVDGYLLSVDADLKQVSNIFFSSFFIHLCGTDLVREGADGVGSQLFFHFNSDVKYLK